MIKISALLLLVLTIRVSVTVAETTVETCTTPPEVVACTASAQEVDRYFNRCVRAGLVSLDSGAGAVALAYHATLLVLDRELQLQARWAPARNYVVRWEEFRSRWAKRLSEHPQLKAYDQSSDLGAVFRGGLALRLEQIESLQKKSESLTKSPGAKFLMAAVYERASTRDRDRLLSTFPELLNAATDDLVSRVLELSADPLSSLRKSLRGVKGSFDRDRLIATFVSMALARNPEAASRLVIAAEQLFGVQADLIQARLEAEIDQILRAPIQILNKPYVLASSLSPFGEVTSTTSAFVAAAQCRQFHRRKFWAKVEGLNDRYVLPFFNYSLYPLVIGAVGTSLTLHWLDATNTVAPKALEVSLPLVQRFVSVVGGGSILAGIPSSLVTLNQVLRREAWSREVFYLSPLTKPGAGATDLDKYPELKAQAFFNVGLNFAFLVGGAVSVLRP